MVGMRDMEVAKETVMDLKHIYKSSDRKGVY